MTRPRTWALVRRSYEFAAERHAGQLRRSGEPYVVHPLGVAQLIADLRLDVASVCAGLLHDCVEDTSATAEDIGRLFGGEMQMLVEGVTKLGQIPWHTREERQAENFRKMLLAMARDIRVILIKLADRLDNMRTLAAHAARQAGAHRPRDPGDLRADGQPPGHPVDEVRAGGPGVQVPRAARTTGTCEERMQSTEAGRERYIAETSRSCAR